MTTATDARWTYRDALRLALADSLHDDPNVLLLGEDVAAAGGVFKVTDGLFEAYGPDRVRDTPISEQAIVGAAIGAAMLGFRPVAEIMFADFAGVCFDQIANQLAKHSYLTGGAVELPVTIRLATGAGTGFGAQHSQPVENWFLGQAGLKICAPSTAADAYALVRAAIRDPGPVLVFESKALYGLVEERHAPAVTALGRAVTVRQGRDATVVASQMGLRLTMEAAEALARAGIEIEVIDVATLRPMDAATVTRSVVRTGRLACVQEGERAGGWAEHLSSVVTEHGFFALDAPPALITSPPVPVPYAEQAEAAWMPSVERIVKALEVLVRS